MSMELNLNKFLEELIQEVEKELDEATATGNVAGYNVPGAFSDGGRKDKKRKKKISTQFGMKIVGKMDEAIKGRNNKTGEAFGMVIGSDKKNREGDFEVTIRITYSARISSYKLTFNSNNELINILDYGYSMDGRPPDMKGSGSGKSVKADKRKTIIFIAKLTSPAFANKIYKHLQKVNESVNETVNEAKVKRPVNRWLALKNDESMHAHKKMAMGLKELKYQLAETQKFFNWYNKIKTMTELDSDNYWKRTNKHIYKIKERLINIARTIQEIEK